MHESYSPRHSWVATTDAVNEKVSGHVWKHGFDVRTSTDIGNSGCESVTEDVRTSNDIGNS